MSLTEVSLPGVALKQYRYKLKAYIGAFSTLIIVQLLGILFSFNGSGSLGTGSYGQDISVTYYSGDMVIIFTMIWGFISAILLTTKSYREEDFALVANRTSSSLSTIAFLATASVAGGITAVLAGFLLKVLVYYIFSFERFLENGMVSSPLDFVMGVTAAIFSVLLFGAMGYLFGMVMQLHKFLVVLLPAAIIGFLIFQGSSNDPFLLSFLQFYFQESSFLLFLVKTISTVLLLFIGAVLVSNQLEVKK